MQPGTRVGDWVVEEAVQDGQVYRCHRADTPFRKAHVRAVRAADPLQLQLEAQALTQFEHPNVQRVMGLETCGDDLFLVADVVQGTPLASFVHRPALPLKAVLEIGIQLADALAHAHQRGIAHRALVPDNVWLRADGTALLSDFHLQNSLDAPALPTAYVPPDWTGDHSDAQRDAYAFGVLMFELLTGGPVKPVNAEMRTALSLDMDVPDGLREVVTTLTHPDPEVRASVTSARDVLGLTLRESLGDTTTGSAQATFVDYDPNEAERPAPGRIGRYVISREIGRGGVGVVYEATDPGLQRRVALKVLLAGSFARARDIERFLREARAVAQLDHPNIVKILEFDREGGGAWFAMDFVPGPTLLERIRDNGPMEPEVAVGIAAQLARALHHAHEHGLVHRDVKPNNVILEEGTRPRLTDFGLALSTKGGESTRLTRTGQVLGTPMYMSPEQASGDLERLGPRTDVYGVGVMLYEALTGRVPFDGPTPLAIMGKVLDGDVTHPRSIVPALPRPVELVCLKAMRRDVDDRYLSARELAEDLERCLRGEPILAAPPSLRDRGRWFIRRNRALLAIAAAAVLAAMVVSVGGNVVLRTRAASQAKERQEVASQVVKRVLARVDELESEHRRDEAESAWQTFATHPDHRGTQALVNGWLVRADHHRDAGDSAARLAALGSAYAASERAVEQEKALLGLAMGLRSERQLERLPEVVDILRTRDPARARSPEVARLHRDALAARRDLANAAEEGPDDAVKSVLRELAQATRTPHHADFAAMWPRDDAVMLLRRGDSDRLTLVGGGPKLEPLRQLRTPVYTNALYPLSGSPARLLASTPGGVTVLLEETRSGRLRRLRRWEEGSLYAEASGDLDGDGVPEHYLGQGKNLYRLYGRWVLQRDVPHPQTNAAASSIYDLLTTDLDGDGAQELVVAAGEWGAYDVRVLRAEPGERELALTSRLKMGVVKDLAVLPHPDGSQRLLASKEDRYANLRVFPGDAPMGVAAGLWRLSLQEEGLTAQQELDVVCDRILTGDLDGNGVVDAAASCGDDLLLLVQDEQGSLSDVWLRDLNLLAVADLDADRALELVVSEPHDDHAVWVLGAGTGAPPPLIAVAHTMREPPDGSDTAFRAAWLRAEDLVYIGQLDQAAAAMEQLAELQWGQPVAWEALLRAADIHHMAGRPDEAAALYMQAADGLRDGVGVVEVLRAAARAWRDAHAAREEVGVLSRLRDAGALDDDEARRLTELANLADPPVARLVFDQALDPRWRIERPLALRRDRDAGLRVEAFGNGVLARMPVTWEGGYLELEVDLQVHRAEWDGGVQIALQRVGASGPTFGLRIDGRGGGEVVWRRLTCRAGAQSTQRPLDADDGRLTAHLHVFATHDGLSCSTSVDGEVGWKSFVQATRSPIPSGDWELVLQATGREDTLALATVHSIILRGAALIEEGEPGPLPTHEARRALADGDARTADTLLATATADDLELRVAIAAERDDGQALRSALGRMLEAGTGDGVLDHLVHSRLDALGTDLRMLLGRQWPYRFAGAWLSNLYTHSTDLEVISALLRHLDGLEAVEPPRSDRLPTLVLLNARRGWAAIEDGRLDLAAASLDRAIALRRRIAEPGELDMIIAKVHLDRAVVAVLAGDSSSVAMTHLLDALRVSPCPSIHADMAAVRPELAPLQLHPDWEAVVEPIRAGAEGTSR